jgi:hypothetical protein
LITADEAYHGENELIQKETGVELITLPSQKVNLPENIDPETLTVFHNGLCESPVRRKGIVDCNHEFKCDDRFNECPQSETCSKYRLISVDQGIFQRIPINGQLAEAALAIRKNCERPFNLLKHREGLEQTWVRSQKVLVTISTIAVMATLLIEIEKRFYDRDEDDPQMQITDFSA